MSDADRAVVDNRSGGTTTSGEGRFLDGVGNRDGLFKSAPGGRWPPNVALDEPQAEELDRQSGTSKSPTSYVRTAEARSRIYSPSIGYSKPGDVALNYGDSGGASRFFYVAKAPKSERPVVSVPRVKLRDDLTPEQVDHVWARLREVGIAP